MTPERTSDKNSQHDLNSSPIGDKNSNCKNNVEGGECEEYNAESIKDEFKTYQCILPRPDELLQQQHSGEILREMIENNSAKNIEMPRFLRHKYETGSIRPHDALCRLLLDDLYIARIEDEVDVGVDESMLSTEKVRRSDLVACISNWFVWAISFGCLHPQLLLPADVIREQFYRVAHTISPTSDGLEVTPPVLRRKIVHRGLKVPNFFLDPEDHKQFPPHIALLVILQDGQKESQHLGSFFNRVAWFLFAFVALVLRLVLEVIGGAGAIWGGSEVFHMRNANNKELWRWLSIVVGVLCFLRFAALNIPHEADDGDILGPAGPWSLSQPARLRAICEHPFHYFVRAQAPFNYSTYSSNVGRDSKKDI